LSICAAPRRKNRTFFFFSYEGCKLRTSTNGLYSVPTDAMRNGDFPAW
jgi:hypothetical protein